MATYKLGKLSPILDDRTLKFSDYTTKAVLSPPQAVHYYDMVAKWPLYYNSVYGDCTCAAAAQRASSRLPRRRRSPCCAGPSC